MRFFLAGAVLILYAALSFWPFIFELPRHVENGARRSADGLGLEFASPGLVRTAAAPRWIDTAIASGQIEILLTVRPYTVEQRGPARIASIGRSSSDRNLYVAQSGPDLVFGLRARDSAGRRDLKAMRLPNVFLDGDWIELRIAISPGRLQLWAAGQLQAQIPLTPEPLQGWDRGHRFTLGNEATGSRPWLGEMRKVVVRAGNEEIDYLALLDDLERPDSFWTVSEEPNLRVFQRVRRDDAAVNLLFYLPIGLLVGTMHRQRSVVLAALLAIILAGACSVIMEVGQIFATSRNPSINDVILNMVGGLLGFALAHPLRHLRLCVRSTHGGAGQEK